MEATSGRLDLLVHMQVGETIMDYLAFSFQGIRYQAMGGCVSGVLVTKEPQCCWAIFLPVLFLNMWYTRMIRCTLFPQRFWEVPNVF